MTDKSTNRTLNMVYIALFAVIMAICAWIVVPMAVPFTMQTFAVFLAVGVLGGKKGTVAVLLYLLLGMIGLPVFSGFTGGVGVLFGNTGGYLLGFLWISLIMWGMEMMFGKKVWVLCVSMVIGLIACYAFGTMWFLHMYAKSSGTISVATVLGYCVFPFIIPDVIKMVLAVMVRKRLLRAVKLN